MVRFRHAIWLVLVTALLTALAAAPAQAVDTRGKCRPKGSKTVAKNDHVRVFERVGEEETRLYGCLWKENRSILMASLPSDYVLYDEYSNLRLVRHQVAWLLSSTDASCKADCPPGYRANHLYVVAYDLRKRKSRSQLADDYAGWLRVNSLGAIAWTERGSLHAMDADGSRVVDSGTITAPRLRGATLSWLNDGQPRSATLR